MEDQEQPIDPKIEREKERQKQLRIIADAQNIIAEAQRRKAGIPEHTAEAPQPTLAMPEMPVIMPDFPAAPSGPTTPPVTAIPTYVPPAPPRDPRAPGIPTAPTGAPATPATPPPAAPIPPPIPPAPRAPEPARAGTGAPRTPDAPTPPPPRTVTPSMPDRSGAPRGPATPATPPPWNPVLRTPESDRAEEEAVRREVEKLSPKEREEIGKGIYNIGFRIERNKYDYFAKTLTYAKSKLGNQTGAAARFAESLRDSYMKEADLAHQKAKDLAEGKGDWLAKVKNPSLILGNVLKFGRTVADLTPYSFASPLRYFMMGGAIVNRLAAAGTEARLRNEELMNEVRLDDVAKAQEEAIKVYEEALKKTPAGEKPSAADMKDAYLMKLPELLKERLKEPATGNNLIQKIVRADMATGLKHMELWLDRVDKKNISEAEKSKEREKIVKKFRDSLEDYDRMVGQYGTVDGLAMLGRYAQTAAKTVVRSVQVETLFLSVNKLAENISEILARRDVPETSGNISPQVPRNATPDATTPKTPANITPGTPTPPPPPSPDLPKPIEPLPIPSSQIPGSVVPGTGAPAGDLFRDKSYTFEKGKGGIEGVRELRKQIRDAYRYAGIPIENAPQGVQDFMSGDMATKKAIELGLYDPSKPEESALIQEGTVMRFDENGNLVFGKPDASGNVPVLEKYEGRMFDSDRSGVASAPSGTPESVELDGVTPEPKAETVARDVERLNKEKSEWLIREKLMNAYESSPEPGSEEHMNAMGVGQESQSESINRNWNVLRKLKAREVMRMKSGSPGALGDLFNYLKDLAKASDLEPKGRGFLGFGSPETVEEFSKRALDKIRIDKQEDI